MDVANFDPLLDDDASNGLTLGSAYISRVETRPMCIASVSAFRILPYSSTYLFPWWSACLGCLGE